MVWVMNVAAQVSQVLFLRSIRRAARRADTARPALTGFAVSQRGLAYDPSTDTYFAGGWNDQMVYQFKADGTLFNGKNDLCPSRAWLTIRPPNTCLWWTRRPPGSSWPGRRQ